MNTKVVTHVEKCTEQQSYADGLTGFMSLDIEDTLATGILHIVEFTVPDDFVPQLTELIDWDTQIELVYLRSSSAPVEMLGVQYVWTIAEVYAIGMR